MILTIGHSTHTPDQFVALARAANLDGIIDVRSHRSSKWPWWVAPRCEQMLRANGLEYQFEPGLGGWTDDDYEMYHDPMQKRGVNLAAYSGGYFPKQRIGVDRVDTDANPEWTSRWTNQGLHDYSWFTTTERFLNAASRVARDFGDYGDHSTPRMALMCSEVIWWKCHRSMVADVLGLVFGYPVDHILPITETVADVTSGTRRVKLAGHQMLDRADRYAPEIRQEWQQWERKWNR